MRHKVKELTKLDLYYMQRHSMDKQDEQQEILNKRSSKLSEDDDSLGRVSSLNSMPLVQEILPNGKIKRGRKPGQRN